MAGPLIQAKALRYAEVQRLPFEFAQPNDGGGTVVGHTHDEWAAPGGHLRPLKFALMGFGVVERGVYEWTRLYPQYFEISHVVVREPTRYPGVAGLTTDHSVVLDESIDIVIICIGGIAIAYRWIEALLSAGKYVITANKAAVATHRQSLSRYIQGNDRRLWYPAAVGGAVPALETLSATKAPVEAIRGIINGTCGFVLDALEKGHTISAAIAMAQSAEFAEAEPSGDLSGRDSADKLALLIDAGIGEHIVPEDIQSIGLDAIVDDPCGYKLIAGARRSGCGIEATVKPENVSPDSFLGQARGADNRLEITLINGEIIYLRGQGAGRWPRTASVLGDLHEVGRIIDTIGSRSSKATLVYHS